MKTVRNLVLTLCLIALAWYSQHDSTVHAQGAGANCSGPQSQCLNEATSSYDLCVSNCNGSSSCQANCKTTETQDNNNCNTSYQSCLQSNNEYCASSYCPGECSSTTGVTYSAWNDGSTTCTCRCGCSLPAPSCPTPQCSGNTWVCNSPIVVDTRGVGFHLTSAENGVVFDFDGNGKPAKYAWTDPAFGNAWLALDCNGNGLIDSAKELFGNLTPQPRSESPNGYRALAVYDLPENGGNGDGYIDAQDQVYSKLLLWTDDNHNGISEPSELHSLSEMHVFRIDLHYWEQEKTDEYGNLFRYKSRIAGERGFDGTHTTWDVFLMRAED